MSEYAVKISTIPPAQDCFGKPSEYERTLAPRLFVDIPDTMLGKVWVGAQTPPADKTDWLWARTSNEGRPIGIFSFYRSDWRPWYPYHQGPDILQPFTGDPTLVAEPWAVADGNNGTTDLRSLFTVVSGTIETAPDAVVQPLKLGYKQFVGYT